MGVGEGQPAPLEVDETEEAFVALLLRDGVALDAMPFLDVWHAFTRFAEVPVATPGDGLLYQWSISERAPEELSIGFLRQLEVVDEHGEWFAYEQLSCAWTFPLTDDLRGLAGNPDPRPTWPVPVDGFSYASWWFRHEAIPLAPWIEGIELRPEFSVVQGLVPLSTALGQERV